MSNTVELTTVSTNELLKQGDLVECVSGPLCGGVYLVINQSLDWRVDTVSLEHGSTIRHPKDCLKKLKPGSEVKLTVT